eukprot:scaffold1905_cov115-Cylindrotheca_fusiformis.AAC.1
MSLERKARWVLNGHLTPDAEYSTFAGVVSRESVGIALTYAALNGVGVWAADIRNAYIQAPSSRKDFIICGPEFGLAGEYPDVWMRPAVTANGSEYWEFVLLYTDEATPSLSVRGEKMHFDKNLENTLN